MASAANGAREGLAFHSLTLQALKRPKLLCGEAKVYPLFTYPSWFVSLGIGLKFRKWGEYGFLSVMIF